MSAKEMFEKLGYNYERTTFEIFYFTEYRETYDDMFYIGIHFNLDDKNFWSEVNIDVDELKAINKQIEELGWE